MVDLDGIVSCCLQNGCFVLFEQVVWFVFDDCFWLGIEQMVGLVEQVVGQVWYIIGGIELGQDGGIVFVLLVNSVVCLFYYFMCFVWYLFGDEIVLLYLVYCS